MHALLHVCILYGGAGVGGFRYVAVCITVSICTEIVRRKKKVGIYMI